MTNQPPADTTSPDPPRGADPPPSRSPSPDELINHVNTNDMKQLLEQILQGRAVSSIYVDARSGGSYFQGTIGTMGDVVGGDVVYSEPPYASPKSASPVPERLPQSLLAGRFLDSAIKKVISVYVQPSYYDNAKQLLATKRVVVLVGNSQSGRRTTAIHLCYHISRVEPATNEPKIFEINPTIRVNDLRNMPFDHDKVYILHVASSEESQQLNDFTLQSLSERLEGFDSYLVVIVDRQPKVFHSEGYSLHCDASLDSRQLMETHLTWYAQDQSMLTQAQTLLATPLVAELLNGRLLPHEIDRLSQLVLYTVENALQIDDTIAQFSSYATKAVEQRFDSTITLQQRSFMIALAVLNGSPYHSVLEASKTLESRLSALFGSHEESPSKTMFTVTKTQRLAMLGAHTTVGTEATEYGHSSVELLYLDNPAMQVATLAYLWHEYDELRIVLLEWLFDLGTVASTSVGLRVAAAVGLLSTYDFRVVREKVLIPWAKSENPNSRLLTAVALGIPAWDERHAPHVLGLLHHWSTLQHTTLRWTAAVAYGGFVGLRYPDIAVQNLATILQSGNPMLFMVVLTSVQSLFDEGERTRDYYMTILAALVVWTEAAQLRLMKLAGLLIFITIAETSMADCKSCTRHATCSTLLGLLAEDTMYEPLIAVLYRRALDYKPTRSGALTVLHQWLVFVDAEPTLYATLGGLLFVMVTTGTDKEKERIFFYLKRWSQGSGRNAALKIYTKLQAYFDHKE